MEVFRCVNVSGFESVAGGIIDYRDRREKMIRLDLFLDEREKQNGEKRKGARRRGTRKLLRVFLWIFRRISRRISVAKAP